MSSAYYDSIGIAAHSLHAVAKHLFSDIYATVLCNTVADGTLHARNPAIWEHVNPYGRFDLDMNARLDLP